MDRVGLLSFDASLRHPWCDPEKNHGFEIFCPDSLACNLILSFLDAYGSAREQLGANDRQRSRFGRRGNYCDRLSHREARIVCCQSNRGNIC
jgi:hypothetical protein